MQMQTQTKLRVLASELAAEARTRAAWFDGLSPRVRGSHRRAVGSSNCILWSLPL